MPEQVNIDARLLAIWREVAELGEPLPAEDRLAEMLGAGRPMVREMLIRMEADGLIRRQHGAGTFANRGALELPFRLDRAAEFSVLLVEAGFVASTELLEAEVVQLDAGDAGVLDIPEGSWALRTLKRWFADGQPVMVARDTIPLRQRIEVPEPPLESVLDLAQGVGRGAPDWLSTGVSAANADIFMARLLGVEPGHPLLLLDQLGMDRHGRRVFHAHEYHAGGLVRFGMVRTVRS